MRGAGGKHDVGNKTENIEQELEWRKLQIVQCHKSWHCSMCSECACASCMIVTQKAGIVLFVQLYACWNWPLPETPPSLRIQETPEATQILLDRDRQKDTEPLFEQHAVQHKMSSFQSKLMYVAGVLPLQYKLGLTCLHYTTRRNKEDGDWIVLFPFMNTARSFALPEATSSMLDGCIASSHGICLPTLIYQRIQGSGFHSNLLSLLVTM